MVVLGAGRSTSVNATLEQLLRVVIDRSLYRMDGVKETYYKQKVTCGWKHGILFSSVMLGRKLRLEAC